MESEDFLTKIASIDVACQENPNSLYERVSGPLNLSHYLSSDYWTTGGMTGGSCWGGEKYARPGEPEVKFVELDQVLRELCPNITYLQFRSIEDKIQIFHFNDAGDYYGNYRELARKAIQLIDLYNEIKELSD